MTDKPVLFSPMQGLTGVKLILLAGREVKTVFLRPVMRSAKETSLEAHFVLQPV
jgi:hypothetical protein